MHLKTFRAPDLATALARAHREMGPDALVLATGETPGRLGLSLVEVTVGVPRERARTTGDGVASPRAEAGADVAGSDPDRPADDPHGGAFGSAALAEHSAPAPAALRAAADALVGSGLSPDLARRFAIIAARDLRGSADARAVAQATTRALADVVRFAPLPRRARCLFVVGPPGAGKTTTVAKLVARVAAPGRGEVFFAEADTERIGALEQAAIYSMHVGARLAWIETVEDLACALSDAWRGSGRVVVDTPGIGRSDRDRVRSVAELRDSVPDAEVALLLPAGLHHREASEVLRRFAELRPTCVGLSRLDDGARPGELITAVADSDLPLAFFTDGHDVPHDLTEASPGALAGVLLRAGRPSGSFVEEPA